jgi:hypothetical protein
LLLNYIIFYLLYVKTNLGIVYGIRWSCGNLTITSNVEYVCYMDISNIWWYGYKKVNIVGGVTWRMKKILKLICYILFNII